MNIPDQSVITVLTYLLPGFITAALVYSLTPNPRPIPFERVVQALIFTMLVQVGVIGVRFVSLRLGPQVGVLGAWTENVRLVWSVVLAGGLGLFVAWMANKDNVHGALRWLGITCQTSFSSEWYGVFSRNKGYVVLHLTGQRRLYGWPEEWPSTPGQGHFVMMQAEWLRDGERAELTGVNRILIRAEDVEMVELMEVTDTPPQEAHHGRSQAANTAATATTPGSSERGTRHNADAAATIQTGASPGASPEA
ncbi:MAG: DUF6338 family protein [Vicinamibacterales bacterium]